jgi:hypothetical protein
VSELTAIEEEQMTSATLDKLLADPTPWMTSGLVKFLDAAVKPDDLVIEYGGGISSLFWAKRAAFTYTVEASPEWAPWLITEMSKRPELLAKWTMQFTPCDWNHSPRNPKIYWQKNRIDATHAEKLTSIYTAAPFHPDIFVIDGSVRPQCCDFVSQYVEKNPARLIVVDNMETMERHTIGRFANYTRVDFEETDQTLIPVHQNGKWCSSVFIAKT